MSLPRTSRLCRAFFITIACVAALSLHATPPAPDDTQRAVKDLLTQFLSRVDDPAMHERFWADDLIYTTGHGVVRTKQQIVSDVAEAARSVGGAGSKTSYGAEQVHVRPYGEFAALNFRLVVINPDGTKWYSRNSGAFLWRRGQWEVVTWQATREAEQGR